MVHARRCEATLAALPRPIVLSVREALLFANERAVRTLRASSRAEVEGRPVTAIILG